MSGREGFAGGPIVPRRRYDPATLHGVMATDPMPWDLVDIATRARARGPVTVIDMQPADPAGLVAELAPGAALLLQWPGEDDAGELADRLRPPAAGRGRTGPVGTARRLDAVAAAVTARGAHVLDGGQWRGAYRFLDAAAVRDFLAMAWWLPQPPADPPPLLTDWDTRGAPIVATLSRLWVLARRPGTAE